MAIWIKKSPDAEPVWMAADNRIMELAISIEQCAGFAPDADRLRKIREWATEIVCQCDMVERVQEQAEPAWKSELQDAFLRSHKNVVLRRCRS